MSFFKYVPPGGEDQLVALADTDVSSPSNGDVLTYSTTTDKWEAEAPASGGASEMNDLSDASTSSEASGQMLVWDGSNWRNRTMGGDVSVGSTGLVTVEDDSHNHTELDNSSGQTVLSTTTIGVDIRDGSGSDPTLRFTSSAGAIQGWIEHDGTDLVFVDGVTDFLRSDAEGIQVLDTSGSNPHVKLLDSSGNQECTLEFSGGGVRLTVGTGSQVVFLAAEDGTSIVYGGDSGNRGEKMRTLNDGIRVTGDTIELTSAPTVSTSASNADIVNALKTIGIFN